RHLPDNGVRRRWVLCDVPMDHFQWVIGSKGTQPGKDLVENYAQRIEVRAVVRGPVHAPRLLRRHVGELCKGKASGERCLTLARAARGEGEVNNRYLIGGGANQDTSGVKSPVNDVMPVQLCQDPGDLRSYAEEAMQIAAGSG